jgi:hypothetical protein
MLSGIIALIFQNIIHKLNINRFIKHLKKFLIKSHNRISLILHLLLLLLLLLILLQSLLLLLLDQFIYLLPRLQAVAKFWNN